MPDTPEGVRLKVGRAREHVVAQQTATRRSIEDKREPFDFRIQDDPEVDNRIIISVSQSQVSPLTSGFSSGTPFRTSARLSITSRGISSSVAEPPNLKSGDASQVQFPVCETLEQFNRNLGRRLPGITAVQETVIRSHQPYKRGRLSATHPLGILTRLSNDDKHRYLQPTLLAASSFQLRIAGVPPGCEVLRLERGPDLDKPFQVDAKPAYIYVRNRAACHGGMEVEAEGTVLQSLGDGLWLDESMSSIDREVHAVLADLSRVP